VDQALYYLTVSAASGAGDLPPPEPWAALSLGWPHPCHIRARTGGKLRSPAVTHEQHDRPLLWTRAGWPPARNGLL